MARPAFASAWVIVLEWASRGALSLVFLLGILATPGAAPGMSRGESAIEGGAKAAESQVPRAIQVRAIGRRARVGAQPWRILEPRRAPLVAGPAPHDIRSPRPRPRWSVPRRTLPIANDDDDDELG